jgi:outer membrane protein assembly factor BamB
MRNHVRTALRLLSALAAALAPSAAAQGDDWPQWRGPNRDGIVRGATLPAQWPAQLRAEWKVPVGEGYASPVVADGCVYVFTRQKDDEVLACFELASGKVLWKSEPCPAPCKAGPAAPGDVKTRATPAVAGERVFTLGVSEILSCFDAKTGKLLWRKHSRGHPTYGASASPLVVDGLCITAVGKRGLTAFDAATGDVKWCYDDVIGGPGYGSPILVDLAGARQVVTVAQNGYLGVALATGKLLWRLPVPRWDIQQCITPVVYRDLLIIADSGGPLRAIRLETGAQGITPREVWKAKAHTSNGYHTCSPVLAGDWLLGFSGQKVGHLYCLDAQTGETLWQSEGRLGGSASGHASLVSAGSVWLALTTTGYLSVMKASGTAYEKIAAYRMPERGTDAYPVLIGDRILIKDHVTLRCLRIAPDPATPSAAPADGRKFIFLDLKARANQQLIDDVSGPGNNLAALPRGEQTIAGVRWQIGAGLIQLSGKLARDRPEKVEGIPVGSRCTRLHFLHATQWQAPDDTTVGHYTVTYDDNSEEKIPIAYGKDVRDWWFRPGAAPPSRARVAWEGDNDLARNGGSRIRLYLSTWNNPHPNRQVVRIDLTSTNSADAAPFCVAITVEK